MAKSWALVALLASVLLVSACTPSPDSLDRRLPAAPTVAAASEPVSDLVLPSRTPTQSPPTSTVSPTPSIAPTQPITYVVQAGDTLGAIAKRFSTSIDGIAVASAIDNVNLIEVGQVITLPVEVAALGKELISRLQTPPSRTPTAVATAATVSSATVPPTLAPSITPVPTVVPAPPARVCCKYCCKGKACGDSCISRSYTCHKPPGCACNRCP